MTFKIESGYIKNQRLKKWHVWFAWFPVRVSENEVVWLGKVNRQLNYRWGDFSYQKLS